MAAEVFGVSEEVGGEGSDAEVSVPVVEGVPPLGTRKYAHEGAQSLLALFLPPFRVAIEGSLSVFQHCCTSSHDCGKVLTSL